MLCVVNIATPCIEKQGGYRTFIGAVPDIDYPVYYRGCCLSTQFISESATRQFFEKSYLEIVITPLVLGIFYGKAEE